MSHAAPYIHKLSFVRVDTVKASRTSTDCYFNDFSNMATFQITLTAACKTRSRLWNFHIIPLVLPVTVNVGKQGLSPNSRRFQVGPRDASHSEENLSYTYRFLLINSRIVPIGSSWTHKGEIPRMRPFRKARQSILLIYYRLRMLGRTRS